MLIFSAANQAEAELMVRERFSSKVEREKGSWKKILKGGKDYFRNEKVVFIEKNIKIQEDELKFNWLEFGVFLRECNYRIDDGVVQFLIDLNVLTKKKESGFLLVNRERRECCQLLREKRVYFTSKWHAIACRDAIFRWYEIISL